MPSDTMPDTLADPDIAEFIAACERAKASLRKAIAACNRAVAEIEGREVLDLDGEMIPAAPRHLFGETGEGE